MTLTQTEITCPVTLLTSREFSLESSETSLLLADPIQKTIIIAWVAEHRGAFDVPSVTSSDGDGRKTEIGLASRATSGLVASTNFAHRLLHLPEGSFRKIDAVLAIASRGVDGIKPNEWLGFISEQTLFLSPPDSAGWAESEFRESLMSILELADTVLKCEKLVICMPKENPETPSLLRAFMYIGFEMVHPSVYNPQPEYLLLGYEL
ncbi:hypothetical protein K493DRAFT_403965 [Basidiobolus meristosporus CBS 931.73]|uniref:Ornithine decarboxylase antizyme n=1 Tax=Basidiobolus meristosporus CBS 931.73 TaxID=1314790 RepID=A0A1Y1Z972_9FUNG|nr:hypothetical protein K493DRAFT_403965 [Basidiobolus meristosporus CBS 931.73]|eukprot:ORY06567.1 hypothetical protein K493DRAFT_403965 [Basidiobolus meristosporus CBS 931.73]